VSGRRTLIAVCGASQANDDELRDATEVGRLLAERGAVVLSGGLGGVMAAVAAAVRQAGGTCIGILPGSDAADANPDLTVALPTGMGEARNALIARMCDAMIAIGGGYGTLSEIAFALRIGKPVVSLGSWEIRRPGEAQPDPGLHRVTAADDAVAWVTRQLRAE
jgi:uncharacterized protein (TIGR00725 family)